MVSGPRPSGSVTLITPTCTPARNCSRSARLIANVIQGPLSLAGRGLPGFMIMEFPVIL
jgi:hypothetical protein